MLIPSNTAAEADKLTERPALRHWYREGYFTAISAGFFFILIGSLFVFTPNLYDKITAFFRNLDVVAVHNMEHIKLIAPTAPKDHMTVYTTVGQFSLILGFFQIALLALRFVGGSPLRRKAETASNVVFWMGAYYLINTYLIDMMKTATDPTTTWFAFWATMIMLLGLSLIVRAIVLAARR